MGYLNAYNGSSAIYWSGNDQGNYQFTSLENIITQFQIAYVGENKLIPKLKKADVAFHAMRALQELSFDTFKSVKAQEIIIPASLQMTLPRDYVNYTKISCVDSAGIKHPLYPTSKTSNPTSYQQDANGDFLFSSVTGLIPSGELIRNGNFHGTSNNWRLNEHGGAVLENPGTPQEIKTTTGDSTDLLTDQAGWFWDNNHIIGYNLPQYQSVIQKNVPIHSGEQYTVTYTISGYSSGSYNFVIVDENGHFSSTTARSANGTYEETITASSTIPSTLYPRRTIYFQNLSATAGNVTIDNVSIVRVGNEEDSTTWSNYKSTTPSENNNDDYEDETYWRMNGERYGLDPQHAQSNGTFFIDQRTGYIHFGSALAGETIILKYISDGLGTDGEMLVHKFCEEAAYKWIAYGILSTRSNIPPFITARFKKEKFAETRKAKIRLSNIKIEEFAQVLKGLGKQIK